MQDYTMASDSVAAVVEKHAATDWNMVMLAGAVILVCACVIAFKVRRKRHGKEKDGAAPYGGAGSPYSRD